MKQPLNIKRLRLLVDDPAGEGQMFSDEEYLTLYEDHDHIYCLAAEIWLLKAGELQRRGTTGLAEYKVGDESYTMTGLKDLHDHAMSMYDRYRQLCDEEMREEDDDSSLSGARWLNVKRPVIDL